MKAEDWPFQRAEAAEIVGITDAQLKNYQARYHVLPERMVGTGRSASYDLRDIMKLAAMHQMVCDGFRPEKAAAALSGYSIWDTLRDGRDAAGSVYPGTFGLTRNDAGDWHPIDSRNAASRYELRVWALLDRVWERFIAALNHSASHADVSAPQRESIVSDLASRLEAIRAQVWGTNTRALRDAVRRTNSQRQAGR